MIRNIFSAVLLFFIQPTFLIGAMVAISLAVRRKKQERKLFRVAINKDNHEVFQFFTNGLIPGVIGSLLLVGAGVPITIEMVIFYQFFALLGLLAGLRFYHPMFTIPLSALAIIGIDRLGIADLIPNTITNWYQEFTQIEWLNAQLIQNVLMLAIFSLLAMIAHLFYQKETNFSPRFNKTKRGKKIATYRLTPFWLMPLILIIPGEAFTELFDWWPVFSIGNESYSFFVLPILIGFRYTVQSQVPKEATSKIAKELFFVALFGLICAIGSFWVPLLSIGGLAVLFLGGIMVLLRHYTREKNSPRLYAPADQGLKIIGIRPNTPAEKMKLQVGETVTDCNEVPIETEDDFYEALAKNSVYCRLKVKDINGEPRLTETALYADDPHGLGVVFLP
ncbi:PDZ domain-containing protein [Desemzia sp. RIT804]|uniref:PDZ domain-containing protein n=1 Tax=Desemzia sp. RIT 804 TaxID=2810209 RepID=UPI00194F92D8|nr:PDZ domain-containing protein [Desemzia sp. RIT 804]MBM6615662.1 PDZ domain-containing protein [Desemzia sp. RIT 804]